MNQFILRGAIVGVICTCSLVEAQTNKSENRPVTDHDIADYYAAHEADFYLSERSYRVLQIVITPRKDAQVRNRKSDDATNEIESQRKAKMLMDKLSSGADFAQLAMDYSEDPKTALTGGDLGYIPESALDEADPPLKQALLILKVGQVSQPIQARDSIRILKLAALTPAGQHDLSDPSVKETIRQILLGQKSGTSQQKP